MSEPYFNNPAAVARLRSIVARWMGTPFVEACGQQARPGIGADCVSFCDRVLAEAGAITPAQWPDRYSTHGGGKEMLVVLMTVLEKIPELRPVWCKWAPDGNSRPVESVVLPGDVLLCSTGYSLHHLALYMGDNVLVHCLNNNRPGVQEGNLFDPVIYRNVRTIYRPQH